MARAHATVAALAGRGLNRVWSMSLLFRAAKAGGRLRCQQHGGVFDLPENVGGAVFFPSTLKHRVQPVAAGRRESLVQWWNAEIKTRSC